MVTENLTPQDIKKIHRLIQEVTYEFNHLPYDQIPWAIGPDDDIVIYKEVLRRLKKS